MSRRPGRSGRWWLLTALTALSLACSGDRLRPGPPRITLEFPNGTTVTSPDTIAVRVIADDPNGLDTVSVALRDVIITVSAFASTEIVEVLFVRIPDSLPPGTQLTLIGTAADLSGLITQIMAGLTVSGNGASP